MVLGLEIGKVAVLEYTDEWKKAFLQEKKLLKKVFLNSKLSPAIEHVGSTAIKGLKAKPIVDIAIGFRDAREMLQARVVLQKKGIEYVPGANQPGMRFMAKGRPRLFHYHLVVKGSDAWNSLIVTRDFLRQNRWLAQEYAATKEKLAEKYENDRIAYATAKAPFIKAISRRALLFYRYRQVNAAVLKAREFAQRREWEILKPQEPRKTIILSQQTEKTKIADASLPKKEQKANDKNM